MKASSDRLNFRIDPEVKDRLCVIAAERGLGYTELARKLIEQGMDRLDTQEVSGLQVMPHEVYWQPCVGEAVVCDGQDGVFILRRITMDDDGGIWGEITRDKKGKRDGIIATVKLNSLKPYCIRVTPSYQ